MPRGFFTEELRKQLEPVAVVFLLRIFFRVVLDYGDTSSMDLRASGTLSGKARLEATVS